MAWIEVIAPEAATGQLKKQYDHSLSRTGRIWNIVSIMSQNPEAMRVSMEFYQVIMFGASPLSRAQREMMAVVVSSENQCFY